MKRRNLLKAIGIAPLAALPAMATGQTEIEHLYAIWKQYDADHLAALAGSSLAWKAAKAAGLCAITAENEYDKTQVDPILDKILEVEKQIYEQQADNLTDLTIKVAVALHQPDEYESYDMISIRQDVDRLLAT
ncbi:MAG: hypothetical protein ACU0CA_14320 [Paracoccaceae bacterium]